MATAEQQLDSTIQIVTPENIAFEYRVAGPFRRLPAFLIDFAIRLGIIVLIFFLGLFAAWVAPWLGFGLTTAVGMVLMFLLEWFYGGLFETFMNGQTPGKWAMGLRVLTVKGQPINGLQAVLRNILRSVDIMPWLSLQAVGVDAPVYLIPLFTLGLLVMSLNRRHQRLGDLASGTMVVIEERAGLRGVATINDSNVVKLAAALPANFEVSRTMATALALYVDRRDRLPAARRREVASYLAQPLLHQFRMDPNISYDLLLCSLYHRAFVLGGEEAAMPASDEPWK